MQTTVKLYAYGYSEMRTYPVALLFVIGNMALPQLLHLLPQGGMTWLPIYFFTLIGAYKYGWKAGLVTAIASPLLNSVLFGMPLPAVLPTILLKSVLLALAAGFTAERYQRVSIPLLLMVVLGYQLAGTLGEWILIGNFYTASQDFRIGIPGMLTQVFGGYLFINYLIRK
ncbi:ECF transporter S component [Phocaeicola sp.]